MPGQIPTTPFGQRSLSLAVVSAQRDVKDCPPGKGVHKWQVFRQICEAKTQLDVSDRALAVLNALMTFHPDTVLVSGSNDLVVFPSNRQLALRAHGIAPSTLRRHLAALVDHGLVLRRDSPNGKRFARRGRGGDIEQAFGFDLGPIVSRSGEFERLAEAVRAERRSLDLARQSITLCRRDIAKMIATGIEEAVPADWTGLHGRFKAIMGTMPRQPDRTRLEVTADDLAALATEILILLEHHAKQPKPGATESHVEHHIQNSNTESVSESEPAFRKSRAADDEPDTPSARMAEPSFSLGMILAACPDVKDYARGEIASWRDLLTTVALVRSLLGISPSAWDDACRAMGELQACIVIAAILQRGTAINSPGGYLRTLTARALVGSFSPGPMIMALVWERRRSEDRKTF